MGKYIAQSFKASLVLVLLKHELSKIFRKQINNINACFVLAPCKLSNVHNMDSQGTDLY